MLRFLIAALVLLSSVVLPEVVPRANAIEVTDAEGFSPWYETTVGGLGHSQVHALAARDAPKTSEVTVTYTGFPPAAQAAFEYGVSILERQFTFSAEVLVSASWEQMDDRLLGSVRFRQNLKDPVEDPDLPIAAVLYPSALATAIRADRVDSLPDVEIRLNSKANWHTDVSQRPSAGTYDLATVALHELLQGYGFASGIRVHDGLVEVNPTVFDVFVVGRDGGALHKLPSSQLLGRATSDEVFFSGPSAKVAAGGEAPRLYAPPVFESGTSLSHLHQWYLGADPDSLLGPHALAGWAFHDPGPITLAVLKDIGWMVSGLGKAARVAIRDQQPRIVQTGQPLPVPAVVTIQDPVGVTITTDSSSQVVLELWGLWDPGATSSCTLVLATKTVKAGKAVFDQCYPVGPWRSLFLKATSSGLAAGMIHIVSVATHVHRAFTPGLERLD